MRPKIKIKFIYLFKMSITFSQNRQQVNVITNDLQILTKIFFKIEIPALPEGFWWGNAIELHVLKNTMIDMTAPIEFHSRLERDHLRHIIFTLCFMIFF